jgi:D-serine deaminase-like pyridoxal phosphate-dependent protein
MLDTTQITTPTLLLNEARARANVARMAARTRRQDIRFRPHFKTHQAATLGDWFRSEGVSAITVSSVQMAHYFSHAGWDDITIAFPVNVRELPAMAELAARVQLGLLVESAAVIDAVAEAIPHPVDLWVEVDAGYHRSGIDVADAASCITLLRAAQAHPTLRLRGLLTHTGQSYVCQGSAALTALHAETMTQLSNLRRALAAAGFGGLEVSIGDTPICSVVDDLGDVDEMRPGNFVFYDWMQYAIGSCTEEEIAVAVACPVVAVYPARHEVILYGGAVHLAKEFIPAASGGSDYGHAAPLSAHGWGAAWPNVHLRSLSQEHGILHAADASSFAAHLAALRVGDLVAVLPIHSCLTADLHKQYRTLDGRQITMMGSGRE